MQQPTTIRPMLCHRYKTHKQHIPYPCYVQPKLNGIRAIFDSDHNRWQSHSRVTKEVRFWGPNILAHITSQLEGLFSTRVILDGELYRHGWPLQRINGAVSVNRRDTSHDTGEVNYHVFDIVADAPFTDRYDALQQLSTVYPYVVTTRFVSSPSAAEHFYALWKREGYEGMVYRNPVAHYGFLERCGNKENRWNYIIKRKDHATAEFTIVGVEEEFDKYARPKGRVGSLVLECDNGNTFRAGSGLSDDQRQRYWDKSPVGLVATIAFEMYSQSGVPLQPRVEEVHDA